MQTDRPSHASLPLFDTKYVVPAGSFMVATRTAELAPAAATPAAPNTAVAILIIIHVIIFIAPFAN